MYLSPAAAYLRPAAAVDVLAAHAAVVGRVAARATGWDGLKKSHMLWPFQTFSDVLG